MKATIFPSALSGTISAIPSKSVAHRLLICAALADKKTDLYLPQTSADIDATIDCLRALGAKIESKDGTVSVSPIENTVKRPQLCCNESGSTLRFMLPVASAVCSNACFTGKGRLPERPIAELSSALKCGGVNLTSQTLPFETYGRLSANTYRLAGNISSQYITGLLLALPLLDGRSRIELTTKLESAAYIDITLAALESFGIEIKRENGGYEIYGRQVFKSPKTIAVDGDWSNAAFFFTAGAIGKQITIEGLSLDSPQGDKEIINILRRFGASIDVFEDRITVYPSSLHGLDIDVSDIPDLTPVLAVAASCAAGKTQIFGGKRLRTKESDRIAATGAMINSLGGKAKQTDDGLIIEGVKLVGGSVQSFNDHRIAMAAAIGAIGCKGSVVINNAEAVKKSYPAFFEDYAQLGGIIKCQAN